MLSILLVEMTKLKHTTQPAEHAGSLEQMPIQFAGSCPQSEKLLI